MFEGSSGEQLKQVRFLARTNPEDLEKNARLKALFEKDQADHEEM